MENDYSELLHGYPDGFIVQDDYVFLFTAGTVYRSTDNGDSWKVMLQNAGGGVLYPSKRGIIFIYATTVSQQPSGGSLKRSTDDGVTWTDVTSKLPKPSSSFFTFSVTIPGELTLTEYQGEHFFYSFDNGDSWVDQSTVPTVLHGTLCGTTNGFLFCGGVSPDSVTDVFHNYSARSTDNGKTWQRIAPETQFTITSNEFICGIISYDSISFSPDLGVTWQSSYLPDSQPISNSTAYPDRKENLYWSLADRASRYSTVTKALQEFSVPISTISDLLVDPDGSITAKGLSFYTRSRDKGQSWSTIPGYYNDIAPDGLETVANDSSGGVIGLRANYCFRSTDFGVSWAQMDSVPLGSEQLNPQIVITPDGVIFSSGFADNIIKSTDLGKTWHPANSGLTNGFSRGLICDRAGVLYTYANQAIYRSTDKGDSWQFMINIIDPFLFKGIVTTSTISCMAASPKGEIFAGTSHDGVVFSSDTGKTWHVIDEHLDSAQIYCLAASPNGDVYGISRGGSLADGIIYRPYHGLQWYSANDGLGSPGNLNTMIVAADGTAYLGTQNRGLWRSQGVVNGVSMTPNNIDKLFIRISPNPASTSMKITYSIPGHSAVKLELCDELGRTILNIANVVQDAGDHTFTEPIGNIPSGVYFVRLTAESGRKSAQIVIEN